MSGVNLPKHILKRRDDRIVIHFDYDCFYASVFESENPALKSLPLAVQQKQIIVTCNYEARRRGLRKLQLVVDAKRACPDVIIVLGEDLTRFRNASKELYNFIRAFSWSDKVERLGFDEVWMDVTDIVDYNIALLNRNDLAHSFLQMSKADPMQGFAFDATAVAGHVYNTIPLTADTRDDNLELRLTLGSHLALHIRHQLEEHKGYTCTVGIATNKLISKLVGNVNKPKGQTTLLPPYSSGPNAANNVNAFLDSHDIGLVPYIGFKLAQKLREYVLGRPATFDHGLVYGPTKEQVTVGDVRSLENLHPRVLEELLAGPGMQRGIGYKVFGLVNGVDDTEVAAARTIPRQISIEDSYVKLDTIDHVVRELHMLSKRLVERMRIDLTGNDDDVGLPEGPQTNVDSERTWLAKPNTLRLTTRARPPLNPDGSRVRTFKRISRSTHAPPFIFSLVDSADSVAQKLVTESLLPLFRKLHPERSGWDLSLVNVACTGLDERAEMGSDIGSIFKKQVELRKEWESEVLPFVDDQDEDVQYQTGNGVGMSNSEASKLEHSDGETTAVDAGDLMDWSPSQADEVVRGVEANAWEDDDPDEDEEGFYCTICASSVPFFASEAHDRFHRAEVEDSH